MTAGDFNQMKTKLRFDGALNDANRGAENDFIEFPHHLTSAEGAEVAAIVRRRAARVLFGNLGKIGAVFNGCFKLETAVFGINKNMAG